MNKKTILRTVALAFVATMGMTSCDKSNPQMDQKANASAKAAAGDMKIAYVEVDSIMSQYKFCKESNPPEEGSAHSEYSCSEAAGFAGCSCQLPAEGAAECLHS